MRTYYTIMKKTLGLILLVLMLGCTTTPQAERDVTGVEIKEFGPDLEEVAAGNNAILRLKVQNMGDAKAEKVNAEIYSCGNLKVDGWVCPKKLEFKEVLNGADLSSNLPGEEYEKIFSLSTKDLPIIHNERLAQDIGLKLSYKYESSATATIPVLSNQRYKEREREGNLQKTRVDTALAPIRVGIISPDQAIGTSPITLDIELEKLIDGYVEDEACGDANKVGCIESVKVELSGKGLKKHEDKCQNQDKIPLWRTGKTTFSCVLKPDCAEEECDAIIKVTAKYRYVTEASTQLTVKGLADGEGTTPGGAPQAPLCGQAEEKSIFDAISLDKEKGAVSGEITVTGKNFSTTDKDVRLYIEGDKYYIENGARITALAQAQVSLTAITGTQNGNGIDPVADPQNPGYNWFQATFKLPSWIATSESGAKVNLFAAGQVNKNRDPTATAGYTNCKKFEVEPKAKITVSPSDAKAGDGTKIKIKGAKFPENQPFDIYFLNTQCAQYSKPDSQILTTNCAKKIDASFLQQTTTDASGSFSNQFELNEAFLYHGNTPAQGYKIPPGAYLILATSTGVEYAQSLNGAGEFTITPGGIADDDGDGVPNSQDTQCTSTPKGTPVCQPGDTGECTGKAGCAKMPIKYATNSMLALKITSTETGSYTVTYDENEKYRFIVKKNGVKATLTELDSASLPLDTDILFTFKLTNPEKVDVTTPMDVYVQGIITDTDLPAEHCAGITIKAGEDINCAILPPLAKVYANAYPTEIKLERATPITGEQNEFILDGFDFTLKTPPEE